ncbi:actin-related protein 2/3 complex subunit 2B-like [Coffea arabica]|uniref:Arp2/3 complex 34 kDa subunit n=1 Tax=Coffea arabica TaxID=13443 RepID=A0ABM4X258_COFAR
MPRHRQKHNMACFQRESPALKEILLRLYRAEKPMELDHHLYEFGSVEYHVQASASIPDNTYLSIATPLLYQDVVLSSGLPRYTLEMVKGISPDVIEIIEPPKEGYKLTLRLKYSRIPRNKGGVKMIASISSVQGVILSSQLKDMLMNVNSLEVSQGMYRPVKLIYHPREPFFVIKQPEKITAVFPMRFKEDTDVIIATAFFQELMDIGSSKAFVKAPHCIWSPIPPAELRGEPIEDLSTNGGFVSFDITGRHVEGKRLDKTVWNLLNFYAFVKYHVKSTRGFIQRRMRTRLESLVEVLYNAGIKDEHHIKKKNRGPKGVRKLLNFSKSKLLKKRYNFINKIKRIRSRIKIHWFSRFRKRWLNFSRFSSLTRYEKLN